MVTNSEKSKKVMYEGEINIGGFVLPCYVLEDGTRVLSGNAMQYALNITSEDDKSGSKLALILSQKTLEPFIYKDKTPAYFEPISCFKGNQKINGYEASILADICEAFLEARRQIKLAPRQERIAQQCEILMGGFARVGITALVDEATGYQYDRERFELQKVLNAYISDEVLKWQLTFTDEFYRHIFRLWKIPYTANSIKNRPGVIGKLTVKYIYSQLPEEVIKRIKSNSTPLPNGGYKHKWHQSLTTDVGREHLKKQINEVVALMSISDTKEQFIKLFNKRYSNYEQIEFEFDDVENANSDVGNSTNAHTNVEKISLFDDIKQ
ncbi:P63C domain-containing protein [Lactococcus raffinolactis]|uniref:P63C domain-containing protein n=1 Tax=Pseudolactococcus raffinolactis TaxID=1366 RepID=UPI0028A0C936|nr:P63C domain-containing protein [Lactococcus raffinolactis]